MGVRPRRAPILLGLLGVVGLAAGPSVTVARPAAALAVAVAPASACRVPAPSAAAQGRALDAIRGPHWTAADLTGSIDLTDGRRLWLYGDTITSGLAPNGGAASSGFTARSSAIVQDRGCFTPLLTGSLGSARSWIPDLGSQWSWPGDGYARSGTVWVYATRLAQVGSGVFGFQALAVDLVELDQATLAIRTVHRSRYAASPVLLGGSVTTDGTWTYLYGRDELGTKRNTYVARVPAANPLGTTTYWTGSTWSAGAATAQPIFTTDVVGGLTVSDLGPAYGDKRYVGVVMDGEFLTTSLEVYHAAAPTGPWWKDTTVTARGLPGDASTWPYMASVHGIDPASGGLHVTWNIGSFDAGAVTRNVHAYGEVHVAVPLDLAVPAGAPVVPAAQPVKAPGGLVPVSPTRVLDTRTRLGGLSRLLGGTTYAVPIVGRGGVPPGATGVLATFTAVSPSGSAYLTVWPCGSPRPNASSINANAGAIAPNTIISALGEAGAVCVIADQDVDLLVDVAGWLSAGGAGFTPIEPGRLADTRTASRIGTGGRLEVQVAGRGGVAATAKAAALNITATGALGAGYVTAWPCDQPEPVASVVNVVPGVDRGDNAVVPLSASGSVCLSPSAPMHLVVDVSGWYGPGGGQLQSVVPDRRLDTRTGQGGYGRAGPNQIVSLAVAGRFGIPATARAVRMNLTAVGPSGSTFVTASPCRRWLPGISNLNSEPASLARANEATVALDARGALCVVSSAATDLLVDITGYVT